MLHRYASPLLALALITSVALSCRLAEKLSGDPKAGTVANLWPDVPPFAGATKADLEIPLGARLAIRAFMRGKVNFIAFTTDKSPADVQAFYTKERMKAAGWTAADEGCIGDTEDQEAHGATCFFKRRDGTKEEGLGLIVGQDQKTKQTEIFYVRIELPEPTPSPNK
jgi:hypothetical protein